jgi:hypothetical protein
MAIKLAVDTGDVERARALLDMLGANPRVATVTPIAARRDGHT